RVPQAQELPGRQRPARPAERSPGRVRQVLRLHRSADRLALAEPDVVAPGVVGVAGPAAPVVGRPREVTPPGGDPRGTGATGRCVKPGMPVVTENVRHGYTNERRGSPSSRGTGR